MGIPQNFFITGQSKDSLMSDCKGWPVLRHAVLSECLYIKVYKKYGTIHLFSSQLCGFFPNSLLASANSGRRSDTQKGLPFVPQLKQRESLNCFFQKDGRW